MTELKTLKDFKEDIHKVGMGYAYLDWYEEQLRQEAIKQIKVLKKDIDAVMYSPEAHKQYMEDKQKRIFKGPDHLERASCQIDWIKHFFNLTEEDLKCH